MPPPPSSTGETVTLQHLIDDRALQMTAVVIPAAAASIPVTWVHATEQVDPRPHLRPSELVCTLGSALVRPHAADTFVAAVADAGAAAIALGLGEVHLEPPDELVSACRRLEVALLTVPHGVPFLMINDVVMRRRHELEDENRRKETTALSRLSQMVRDGLSEDALYAELATEFEGARFHRTDEPPGVGVDWTGQGAAPSESFLGQIANVVELGRIERAREASEYQVRLGELVGLIMSGLAHPAAILPDLEAKGIDQDVIRVSSWPPGSEGVLGGRWTDDLIAVTRRSVVLIGAPRSAVEYREPGLVCGYSSIVELPRLRRALTESDSALRLARRRGGVAGPHDLVTLDALLEQQSPERLEPFVEHLLTPLIRADEDSRGDLLLTLTAFISNDRQVQATAEALYVHVNTVRHRLSRILELTGRDPLTLSGFIDLKIASWAAERRRNPAARVNRPARP
jgi:hypothetical protein